MQNQLVCLWASKRGFLMTVRLEQERPCVFLTRQKSYPLYHCILVLSRSTVLEVTKPIYIVRLVIFFALINGESF